MSEQACVKCGQVVPAYYLSQGYCDCCKWDTWIPAGFDRREQYAVSKIWGHVNATKRPALGVSFLDDRRLAAGELLAMCKNVPRSWTWAPGSGGGATAGGGKSAVLETHTSGTRH